MAGNSCGFTVACSYYFQTASAINHTSPEVTTKKTRPCECKHIPTATTEGTKFLGMKEAAFDIESRVQPALGVLCSGTGEHCSLNKFLHKELSKKQNHSLLMVSFPHPHPHGIHHDHLSHNYFSFKLRTTPLDKICGLFGPGFLCGHNGFSQILKEGN